MLRFKIPHGVDPRRRSQDPSWRRSAEAIRRYGVAADEVLTARALGGLPGPLAAAFDPANGSMPFAVTPGSAPTAVSVCPSSAT